MDVLHEIYWALTWSQMTSTLLTTFNVMLSSVELVTIRTGLFMLSTNKLLPNMPTIAFQVRIIIIVVGFALAYGGIFAKTWKIHVKFSNKTWVCVAIMFAFSSFWRYCLQYVKFPKHEETFCVARVYITKKITLLLRLTWIIKRNQRRILLKISKNPKRKRGDVVKNHI